MKKLYIVIVLLVGILTQGLAQDKIKASGVVKDDTGEPLPGITVLIRGTNQAVISDMQGNFAIDTKSGAVLQFSCVGYVMQEVKATTDPIRVTMALDMLRLKDVVVTGYSRQERRDVLGSVSTVKPRHTTGALSLDQLLQGQAAGVMMSNASGALGAANLLTIRGVSSVMGDNNPLYVIDGVPIFGTGRSSNLMSTSGGSTPAYSFAGTSVSSTITNDYGLKYNFEKNPLTSLNPEDIESVEILKDAFATAIYGSRGSAGVILITTKKGSRDRTKVDVNYSFSIEDPIGNLNLLNGPEYNLIYSLYYPASPFTSGYNTDWIKAVTRQATGHNFSASVSGGTEKTNYFISAGVSRNESYIVNNSLNRYSARINLDSRLSKYATIGTNVMISRVANNALSAPTIYALAARKAPNLPIRDEYGKYFYGQGQNPYADPEVYNPLATAMLNKEGLVDNRVTGNLYLEILPTSWLTFRSELGMDVYNTKSSVRKADVPLDGVIKNQAQESVSLQDRFVINNTLNITREMGDHFIQAILGQSYETSKIYANSVVGYNFFSPDQLGVGSAQTKSVSSAGTVKSALFSAFARATYQFKRRYMLGVTYRLDGSSAFNKDNRYLHTPSVSLGWRLSEEEFIQRNLRWVDELKIRASLGWASKDGNPNYYGSQAVYTISSASYGGNQYLGLSSPGNSKLKWEKTRTIDLGLDATLWNRRIDLTVEYYTKKTTNMLFNAQLPGYTGYPGQNQNIGSVRNSGVELRVNSFNIKLPNFQWMTTLTLTKNANKILKLNYTGSQLDYLNNGFKYYAVGYPMAQFYLHEWAGVNPQTGNPLWRYKDGSVSETPPASDNATSNANKFIKGSGIPDFYGGLNNSFLFHGFELNFLFTFSQGGMMFNNTKAQLMTYATSSANNLDRDALKFWQIYGQHTGMPKLKNQSITSGYDYTTSSTTTRFLEDNSYIRLKNLEVAYNFQPRFLDRVRMLKQIRIYVSVSNVFTLTKYSGIDPEVSAYGSSATSAGYDNLTMPQTRAYQFGIRLGF